MTKPEAVKDAALQRIGCPYVYGGTGKVCSPSYREARMAQYPAYAAKIEKNCPRLSGSASTCTNCRWYDPETGKGKLCYDCAQLARACMAAAGIPLVSGANSQWGKTNFSEIGTINAIPKDMVCLVFRDDGGKMGHVGVYIGDGTVVHARGHDYGVVRQSLSDTEFTHYGVPCGLYDDLFPTLRRGNTGEYVRIMQQALKDSGLSLDVDGQFGAGTEAAVKQFQKTNGLTADGICGQKTWDKLQPYIRPLETPEEDTPADQPTGNVSVSRDSIIDMLNQLDAMRQQLDGMAYIARGWID